MDSSDLQPTNSTESSSSDIADNSSMMVPSKRDLFLSTYNRRQNFPLPDSLMHYIAKNPKNSNVYQKMIKRCKYFFIKNPILVLPRLCYFQNGWTTSPHRRAKSINNIMNTISAKLWITDELHVSPDDDSNNSIVSSIIPKIYQCDFKELSLSDQIISYHELMFLCSSVKNLDLHQVTVKNEDRTVVPFDKLIEQLPNVKNIYSAFANPSNNTSKKTFKELWKIPHLSNYDDFYLYNIPEDFNIDCFYSFMKKNKKTSIFLNFSDEISEEYKARLEAIIDEIIATENHEFKPPYIYFPGLGHDKYNKLRHLFEK